MSEHSKNATDDRQERKKQVLELALAANQLATEQMATFYISPEVPEEPCATVPARQMSQFVEDAIVRGLRSRQQRWGATKT